MPVVDHGSLPETPWRPDYRKWDVTQPGDGSTSSSLSINDVGVGVGAPLHSHEADELLTVLEGTLEVRLGDEVSLAGPEQTVVVPPNVPHGFRCVGPGRARVLAYFPIQDPFDHTTYLEGSPPAAQDG